MKTLWSGRAMLCQAVPEGGGAGASTEPVKKAEKKEDPPVEPDGRTERAVLDDVARHDGELKRVLKHLGLDGDDEDDEEEEPVAEKKKKKDEPVAEGGEASLEDVLAGDFELGGGDAADGEDDEADE